jgi:hypothetical protein
LALVLGGGERGAGPLEAAIAATALSVVLALLVWLYQTARPLAHSVTLHLIDAAIPTVGVAPLSEPTSTVSSVVAPPTAIAAADAATLPTSPADEPTVSSPRADEPTVRSPRVDEPTVRSPRLDPDVTLRVDPEATLPAEDAQA